MKKFAKPLENLIQMWYNRQGGAKFGGSNGSVPGKSNFVHSHRLSTRTCVRGR
jgi:hypothetical protein